MIRAILKEGVLHPLDPLPAEWTDGREFWVEEACEESPEELDKWSQELKALAAEIDPEDIARLEAALAEADKQAKEMVRRQMGLP